MLLLMLCGDIGSCPGPSQVPLEEFMGGRGLKIFHQNVRGLFANIVHVQELFDRFLGVDIMTMSETLIVNNQYNDRDGLCLIHLVVIPLSSESSSTLIDLIVTNDPLSTVYRNRWFLPPA